MFVRDIINTIINKFKQIILNNWVGRLWLLIGLFTIVRFWQGVNSSTDIPYINYWLCFTFWSFVFLVFCSFDKKLKIEIVWMVVLFFTITYAEKYLSEMSYGKTYNHDSYLARKIYMTTYHAAGSFASKLSEGEMTQINDLIDSTLAKSEYVTVKDRIHILIKHGDEICYEKNFADGITDKFNIENINSSNILENIKPEYKDETKEKVSNIKKKLDENNISVEFQYAFERDTYKRWLITGSFYTLGISTPQEHFITSRKYEKSFAFIFNFLALWSWYIFLCKNSLSKKELKEKNQQIEAQNEELQESKQQLEERNLKIEEQREELEAQNEELRENKQLLEDRNNQIEAQNEELAAQQSELEQHRDELEAQNIELQEKNDKLHRFELVYNRMMADVKKTAKYDPIQGVQVMAFSWRDFIDTQIRSGRHSLRNKVTGREVSKEELKAFEDVMYATVINPTVEKIVSQLNKTVDMIDTEPTKVPTKTIFDEICKHIDGKHFTSRAERKHISVHTEYDIDGSYVCDVNLHRLKAIVENLCFNTQQAFFKKRDELDDAGGDDAIDAFDVSVDLTFSITRKDGKDVLYIDYRDNAMGFPDELLPKIYRSPVSSSKGGDRKGEGTMYISFFVENMNGSIEAENQIDENGRKYAVTKIFIPTKVETGEA